MSQSITCACGEVFSPAGEPGTEVRCPRCFQPLRIPAAPGMLGYMGPGAGTAVMTMQAIELLRQTSLWVRIMSILMFVGSGFMLLGGGVIFLVGMAAGARNGPPPFLGCVYVPLALLYVIPAIFLWRYASFSKAFSISRDEGNLEMAIQAQKSFWKFVAITALIVIGLYILLVAAAIAVAALHV